MKKNWFKLILPILVLILCFSLFVSVGSAEAKIRWVRTEPGNHKFILTKGKDVEVCEAYLKRLNKTWFDRLPFCDRPENTDVPGFEKLNRVALTPEEIYPIYYRITGFMSGDQYRYDKQSAAGTTDVLRPEKKERQIQNYKRSIEYNQLGAYRYDPPIDFDNDQKPDNLLVWKEIRCGQYETHGGNFPQSGLTVVLVLLPDSSSVDETRTKELIGHPIGGYPKPDGKSFFDNRFRPIGGSMGIFRFKGATYFDTFFDGWGDFEGRRRESPDIGRTLGVFKREKGQTKQVCECQWEIPYEQ